MTHTNELVSYDYYDVEYRGDQIKTLEKAIEVLIKLKADSRYVHCYYEQEGEQVVAIRLSSGELGDHYLLDGTRLIRG